MQGRWYDLYHKWILADRQWQHYWPLYYLGNAKHRAIRLSKRKQLISKQNFRRCDTAEDASLHTVSQGDNSQLANMYSL